MCLKEESAFAAVSTSDITDVIERSNEDLTEDRRFEFALASLGTFRFGQVTWSFYYSSESEESEVWKLVLQYYPVLTVVMAAKYTIYHLLSFGKAIDYLQVPCHLYFL